MPVFSSSVFSGRLFQSLCNSLARVHAEILAGDLASAPFGVGIGIIPCSGL